MALKERKYKYNQTILKVYGTGNNKRIKLITMKTLKTKGLEIDDDKSFSSKGSVNDEKLENNIGRAKSKIFEYAFCNPWSLFITITFSKDLHDRTNLSWLHTGFTKWLKSYNRYHKTSIKFLLIPELHEDGVSWHFHGFLMGLPIEHLSQFCIGDTMGKAIAEKVKKGDIVYNWTACKNKFGFNSLEPIRNHEAISKYVTKYITKGLAKSVTDLNAHLFYHSRGLSAAEEIKRGTMSANIVPTYENDYCSISWLPYNQTLIEELTEAIF